MGAEIAIGVALNVVIEIRGLHARVAAAEMEKTVKRMGPETRPDIQMRGLAREVGGVSLDEAVVLGAG